MDSTLWNIVMDVLFDEVSKITGKPCPRIRRYVDGAVFYESDVTSEIAIASDHLAQYRERNDSST